jgi:hypothetical protein
MPGMNQQEMRIRIAVAALLLTVILLLYAVYANLQTSKRVEQLEERNAINDSIQQASQRKLDSIRDAKLYQSSIQAYEKVANNLFTENQNLKNSGDHYLTFLNKRDKTLSLAVAFHGINNIWFTEGLLSIKPNETARVWGVDSSSSVYVHVLPKTVSQKMLINGDDLSDMNVVNLSIDTTASFIFTGNTPPPHKTAHLAIFHEVIPTPDNKVIFGSK